MIIEIDRHHEHMLDQIVDDFNKKWKAAGGTKEISTEEAIEIMIEDIHSDIYGYNESWHSRIAEKEKKLGE